MDALRKSGDSVGARVDVIADGVPPGWGEPIYGKLDGELASALMSINAVKGVEIGDGFGVVAQKGSEHRDEMTPQGFAIQPRRRHPRRHQHAASRCAARSRSSRPRACACRSTASTSDGNVVEVVTTGRHDPCVGIRATPICEAMVALVLMDQALRHRAQCGDVGDGRRRAFPARLRLRMR